jgi:hypothetical protein
VLPRAEELKVRGRAITVPASAQSPQPDEAIPVTPALEAPVAPR